MIYVFGSLIYWSKQESDDIPECTFSWLFRLIDSSYFTHFVSPLSNVTISNVPNSEMLIYACLLTEQGWALLVVECI